MDKERYQKAKPIFDAAVDLPLAQRDDHLASACGDDVALRELVSDLLREHDTGTGPRDGLDVAIERSVAGEEISGSRIDRYRLVEPIGEGGFGTVWKADQREPVARSVALKVIKLGMDTRQVVARFEAERQALALMDHPHIAQVHDGGVTATGRPYFAMELVDGEAITRFCERHSLSLRDRLLLFVKVCGAIQHAHQKGVIHRDVKPSNVLVSLHDGEPYPKVIDFGIAKATSAELTQRTLLTDQQQVLGTPEYMAPEQVDGSEDLDTRVDVYALGVLLYELLTGERPFDASGTRGRAGLEALFRRIADETPSKPSTRVATAPRDASSTTMGATGSRSRLRSALRGDLDWIVMRALEKDRSRRYDTAAALAADVLHHLRDEPVSAGPPSSTYRLRKFVARNRAAVTVGGLIFTGLIACIVVIVPALHVALEQKERADREATNATRSAHEANDRLLLAMDAVDDYYTGVSGDLLLKQPQFVELRDRLLRTPASFYERISASLVGSSGLSQRAALARALEKLAGIQTSVGAFDDAVSTFGQAIDAWRLLADAGHEPADSRLRQAMTLGDLGALFVEMGRVDDGERTLRESIRIAEELKAVDPAATVYDDHYADAYGELGTALRTTGRLEEAEEAWQRALDVYHGILERAPLDHEANTSSASTLHAMGRLALNAGDVKRALDLFERARLRIGAILERHPDSADLKNRMATAWTNLGNAQADDGDSLRAVESFRSAVRLLEENHVAYPSIVDYRAGLGNVLNSLANRLATHGDEEGAAEAWTRAIELLDGAPGSEPLRFLATALQNFASFQWDQDERDESLALFERAIQAYDSLDLDAGNPDVIASAADCYNNYALLQGRAEVTPRVIELMERSGELRWRAVEAYPDSFDQWYRLYGVALNLGQFHQRLGALEPSRAALDEAILGFESLLVERQEGTPPWRSLRDVIRRCYWARANTHQMADRYVESTADWFHAATLDQGQMRAPYLTQWIGDLVRGDLLGEPEARVEAMIRDVGATPSDLGRIAAALLQGDGNEPYRPTALVLARRSVEEARAANAPDVWRYLDTLASAQLQNHRLDEAAESIEAALRQAPDDVDARFRGVMERRKAEIDQALAAREDS